MDWETVVAAIGIVAAVCGLAWEIHLLRRGLEDASYGELDQLYYDLLKIRIERPELADPPSPDTAKTLPPGEAAAHQAYGCMVWNFIETVVDRCDRSSRNFAAWGPAVEYESRQFASWLMGANRLRYSPDFDERVARVVRRVQAARAGGRRPRDENELA